MCKNELFVLMYCVPMIPTEELFQIFIFYGPPMLRIFFRGKFRYFIYHIREKIFQKYIAPFEQCPPLKRFTLGQHKSDNNSRMIQLTDLFCVLFTMVQQTFDYN